MQCDMMDDNQRLLFLKLTVQLNLLPFRIFFKLKKMLKEGENEKSRKLNLQQVHSLDEKCHPLIAFVPSKEKPT